MYINVNIFVYKNNVHILASGLMKIHVTYFFALYQNLGIIFSARASIQLVDTGIYPPQISLSGEI
jgi:hypothetical protein